MKKLTFKVSAKTARLIGRENIANAEGAVAELVKNTYDADASVCLIYFRQRYSRIPYQLSRSEYQQIRVWDSNIENFYESRNSEDLYQLKENLSDENVSIVKDIASKLVDLWIIDNGNGMDAQTIENHWMVIGTNYKEANFISPRGRMMTGEKGIGRFALDRLGITSQIVSTDESVPGEFNSIVWDVDWNSFDVKGKVLEDITAELREDRKSDPRIFEIVKALKLQEKIRRTMDTGKPEIKDWNTGTAIRISFLRDDWSRNEIDRLFDSLSALVPPVEQQKLYLFLFDDRFPESYGLVSSASLSDFDYRIDANVMDSGSIEFRIVRNELDHDDLNLALFEMDDMTRFPFDAESFKNREVRYEKSFEELFPGENENYLTALKEIGSFRVSLMFFKRGRPNREDQKRYPYKNFQPGSRKAWLDKFGGIKIYRDNFLVRPYGEVDSKSFDWLTLGQRVALNPAPAARKGWKVSPQNVAGTIQISRGTNSVLADQSNREGIIENKAFFLFKSLVIRIVKEFEDDRSCIHSNLSGLYKKQNKNQPKRDKGESVAKRIIADPASATAEDARTLAHAFGVQMDDIKELYDEQAMLRSLATLGTVLVSFSHEMRQLQTTMGNRADELSSILTSYIDRDGTEIDNPFHPYTILEDWTEDDQKVKQWFTFALSSIYMSRKRRKSISLKEHLDTINRKWSGFLKPRYIELVIEFATVTDFKVLAFAFDLDSIFNNLILNSVEALLSNRHQGNRKIEINVSAAGKNKVKIDYKDNGPGLHPSIKNPREIFDFSFTTKVDREGNQTGTGLGMWILDSVVNDYGGFVRAYPPNSDFGFRTEIQLPMN